MYLSIYIYICIYNFVFIYFIFLSSQHFLLRCWELFLPHHTISTDFPQGGEKCFLQAVRLIYLHIGRNKRSLLKTKNPCYNLDRLGSIQVGEACGCFEVRVCVCVRVYSAHKHTYAECDGLESFRDDSRTQKED